MNTPYDCFNCDNELEEELSQVKISHYCYFPHKVIGYGSFGSVFEGLNNETNEPVAIKIIQLKRVNSSVQKQLLQNEKALIQQLVGLELKNIIKYLEVIQLPTQTCIVMEYCPGGDLQNLIKKQKLTLDKIKIYTNMLIQGLINLFSLYIVHRDLKPSNILIDKNGNLKIADFGFAVLQNQDTKKYGYCVGSPAYCSPQALKNCQFGPKSDIWALGVTLYKMLTGKTPWKGKNNKQISQNIRLNPITQFTFSVGDQYTVSLIKSFCHYEVNQRYGLKQLQQIREILLKQAGNIENRSCEKNGSDQKFTVALAGQEQLTSIPSLILGDKANISFLY